MTESDLKPTNPKDMAATARLPLHLVPDTLKAYAALAFAEGAAKYGAYNWRRAGVRASVYRSAVDRHLAAWWNGEDVDPMTGVPHLASAIAGLAIILDADLLGKMTDDRPPASPVAQLQRAAEEKVARLQALFAGRNPHHHTIADDIPGLAQPEASA
jgi:hypothetical protein